MVNYNFFFLKRDTNANEFISKYLAPPFSLDMKLMIVAFININSLNLFFILVLYAGKKIACFGEKKYDTCKRLCKLIFCNATYFIPLIKKKHFTIINKMQNYVNYHYYVTKKGSPLNVYNIKAIILTTASRRGSVHTSRWGSCFKCSL